MLDIDAGGTPLLMKPGDQAYKKEYGSYDEEHEQELEQKDPCYDQDCYTAIPGSGVIAFMLHFEKKEAKEHDPRNDCEAYRKGSHVPAQ